LLSTRNKDILTRKIRVTFILEMIKDDLPMNKKKIFQLIVISAFCVMVITSLIFFISCIEYSSAPQYSMTINESDHAVLTSTNGNGVKENFGVGLYNAPFHDAANSMHYSKYLEENESFTGYLYLSNQMSEANDFLVFCLFDYTQVPFETEDGYIQVTRILQLKPFEEVFFPFNLGTVSKGAHDFEIFVIMKPNEHSLNETFRRSTDISYLGSRRINVFVGNSTLVEPSYMHFDPEIYSSVCGSEYPVNNGILITKQPCSRTLWFTENVKPDDILDYSINAAADNRYPVSFALVALLDYIQVPVQIVSKESTFFGRLEQGEKVSIPAQVQIPSVEGIHELMVVWMPAPYHKLEEKPGSPIHIPEGIWSTPSTRVGLNVTRF